MQLEIGSIYNGKVSSITDYGAFVKLENGKTGMVHISEVSNGYVKSIKDILTENQEVKVKLISISDGGKISLSISQAMSDDKNNQKKPVSHKSIKKPNNVWQGQKNNEKKEELSFEDMMARFKKVSDEKMTDLKRAKESKHGSSYSRKR